MKQKQTGRYQRGREALRKVHGERGVRTVDGIAAIVPDAARLIYEFAYGDIFSRPGLDAKTRQVAILASLVTLGNARPQLKAHVHGALHLGWSRRQILEMILQLSVYAGFPVCLNGLAAAQEVFREIDGEKRAGRKGRRRTA